MTTWRWPQYVMAAIYLIQIGMHMAKDGEPLKGKYNYVSAIVATAIVYVILRAGGFY